MILMEQESMESLFTPLVQNNFILFIACSKLGSEVKTGERMMEGKFIADHVSEECVMHISLCPRCWVHGEMAILL